MGTLSKMLLEKKLLLCSGAWATELMRCAHGDAACAEALNTQQPELVRNLCAEYASIPVDLLGTNTFSANRFSLATHGLAEHTASINYTGAALAREAAMPGSAVCGLIGPISVSMPHWDEVELIDAYKQQAKALHTGGAQVLWLETVQSLQEALLAISALKEATPCDIICSFTLLEGKFGYSTYCGMFAHEALREVAKAEPDAIGFNCGNGPEECGKLMQVVRAAGIGEFPLVYKPNAGLPNLDGTYPHTSETFAMQMRSALDEGFNIIGGCCGAGAEHTRALREICAG